MVLQFMLEGPRPWTILCFNVHTTVEYLTKNVSIGQLLQHIPNSIVVCAGSRPKRQTKTYNKEVCQVSYLLPSINYGLTNRQRFSALLSICGVRRAAQELLLAEGRAISVFIIY